MRRSGILLHISSLPSDYGIGKLGKEAFAFADFLKKSGTSVWQILPISPTSYGDSPYQSFSVHAGNPYFIDFEKLEEDGLLEKSDYSNIDWGNDFRHVDYAKIYENCFSVLRKAFEKFDTSNDEYKAFCKEQSDWLADYSLFMALKFDHNGDPWNKWEKSLAMREKEALKEAKKKYAEDIAFFSVIQYWFYTQWSALKTYCNKNGISIIGDIPIYVAFDSVEVWSQPELFCLDGEHMPIDVAGCPPDIFSPTGQLWGNPLYDWAYHKKSRYTWWIKRLKKASTLYDTVRIDHFRGFESFYTIPYGNPTAEIGEWRLGPGYSLFEAAKKKLGDISIIAEDLGFITPEVHELLEKCGYPGMKVLQFAFDGDPENNYLPQNYTTSKIVAYTGTHDNMTLSGWANDLKGASLSFAKRYLRIKDRKDLPEELLHLTWSSCAELAVAQIQDFLNSEPGSRMNIPSTASGNWQYRTVKSDYTSKLAKKILQFNTIYNRLLKKPETADLSKNINELKKSANLAEKKGVLSDE